MGYRVELLWKALFGEDEKRKKEKEVRCSGKM